MIPEIPHYTEPDPLIPGPPDEPRGLTLEEWQRCYCGTIDRLIRRAFALPPHLLGHSRDSSHLDVLVAEGLLSPFEASTLVPHSLDCHAGAGVEDAVALAVARGLDPEL